MLSGAEAGRCPASLLRFVDQSIALGPCSADSRQPLIPKVNSSKYF
jgi:hypothetical protein